MKPSISLRLTLHYALVWFCVLLVQRMCKTEEDCSLPVQGSCVLTAELIAQQCRSAAIVQKGGWNHIVQQGTYFRLQWTLVICSYHSSVSLSLSLLLFISLFCSSLKLHHHQPFSLCLAFSLSLLLLHNVQLYLLQLRFLIFPMRQNARANQERRGADRDNLFNLPVCTATLTQSPHQLIWCRAFFTCTTKTVFKAHVCVCVHTPVVGRIALSSFMPSVCHIKYVCVLQCRGCVASLGSPVLRGA